MSAIGFVTNTKVSGAVAGTTTTSSLLRILDLIPNDIIVKCSLLFGLLLTIILIFINIQKYLHEKQRNKLDIEMLRVELEEHKKSLRDRT